MFTSAQIVTIFCVLMGVFFLSIVLSVIVILKYFDSLRKIPREVTDISHDGYVYKLANGEVISVFKMKRRIIKGYVYWYQTKDNLIKYETLIGKINTAAEEGTSFVPNPYYKEKKFKVDI